LSAEFGIIGRPGVLSHELGVRAIVKCLAGVPATALKSESDRRDAAAETLVVAILCGLAAPTG
jgi:hypothetical protein